MAVPVLDHVVLDVRTQMDSAAATYRKLGFQLTERGYHTLGSINHLAVFRKNYLELLGVGLAGKPVRSELADFPIGMNGLVFATGDADAQHRDLQSRGIPVRDPQTFSRPISVSGDERHAQFRTVHVDREAVPFGRLYFCQHFTPDLIWRPEWWHHPNGAQEITGLLIAARDPRATAGLFVQMFGAESVAPGDNGGPRLMAGGILIDVGERGAVDRQLGDCAPDPAGRDSFIAALRLRTASLEQAAQILQTLATRIENGCLRVGAAVAGNVTLEFTE